MTDQQRIPNTLELNKPVTRKKRVEQNQAFIKKQTDVKLKSVSRFWRGEFETTCPYDPEKAKLTKDTYKIVYTPTTRRGGNKTHAAEGTTPLFPKIQSVNRAGDEPAEIGADAAAVLEIRAALLRASRFSVDDEEHQKETILPFTSTTEAIPRNQFGKQKQNISKFDTHEPGLLVRGTKTTLQYAANRLNNKAQDIADLSLSPECEPASASFAPKVEKPDDDVQSILQSLGLFTIPSDNVDAYKAAEPPKLVRRSFRTQKVESPLQKRQTGDKRITFKENQISPGLSFLIAVPSAQVVELEKRLDAHVDEVVCVVGEIVDAKLYGRSEYVPGKVIRVSPDGCYDIEYVGGIERDVPAEAIRRKAKVTFRNLKSKFKSSGAFLERIRELRDEDKKPDDNESNSDPQAATKSSAKSNEPGNDLGIGSSTLTRAGSSKYLTRNSSPEKINTLASSAADLDISAAEALAQVETAGKIRLWTELRRLVYKLNNEINEKDISVKALLGRGKFSAVYTGTMFIQDEAEDGYQLTSIERIELNVAIKATQFKGALQLPEENLIPKSRQMIQRHVSIIEKQPDIVENDGSESIENLPPPKIILEYMREIRALGVLQHENIVIMHGVLLKPRLCIVIEHMDNKNLFQ